MFVIVQDIIKEAHKDLEDFDCFDILTTPTGFPMKFKTEVEAIKFLNDLGIDMPAGSNEGEIRIDRLH